MKKYLIPLHYQLTLYERKHGSILFVETTTLKPVFKLNELIIAGNYRFYLKHEISNITGEIEAWVLAEHDFKTVLSCSVNDLQLFQQFFACSPRKINRLAYDIGTHYLIIDIKRKRYYKKKCIK